MYKLFVIKSFSWFEFIMFALLCVSYDAIIQLIGDIAGPIFLVVSVLSVLFINWFVSAAIQGIDEYYNHNIKGNDDGK